MKKLSVALVCVAAFLWTTPAGAQIKWGLDGGVNMSKASIKGGRGSFGFSNRTGWFVGPKVQVMMPVIGLGIDASLLYSQKYMRLEYDGEYYSKKSMSYVEIPVNLRYNYGFNSLIGAYLATGPQYNYYVGHRDLHVSADDSAGRLKRSSFSWNVGGGVTILGHLQLGVTYNITLGETGNLEDNVGVEKKKFDLKNNTCQVRLTYLF